MKNKQQGISLLGLEAIIVAILAIAMLVGLGRSCYKYYISKPEQGNIVRHLDQIE